MSSQYNFKSLSKLANYAIIFSIVVGISIMVDNTMFEFVTLLLEGENSLLSSHSILKIFWNAPFSPLVVPLHKHFYSTIIIHRLNCKQKQNDLQVLR